ncbi:MAG: DUF2062 domain-containing protein [Desulfobacterales bacterium]|nr:DUF2062 domain-containing protein [Desulfobacterales bacterium]
MSLTFRDCHSAASIPQPELELTKNQKKCTGRHLRGQVSPIKLERTPETPSTPRGRTRRFARYFYDRFIRLHGSPEQVAWGAAVGFFVAMTPTMGIQTYIAIPIAAFFRINKVAAAATVWITNPVTAPFIYGFNYVAGAKLLGYPLKASFFSNPSFETLWHTGKPVFLSLVAGGTLTGIIVGIAGYFLTLGMVRAAREKARRLKRKRTGAKS